MTLHQNPDLSQAADPHCPPEWLDLALPDTLPAAIDLTVAEQRRLRSAIAAYRAAIALPDRAAGRAGLQALLAQTPPRTDVPRDSFAHRTPTDPGDIAGFDAYFHIRRVDAACPADALLAGLVQATIAAQGLALRVDTLPADAFARQMAGFDAFACLLALVCGLEAAP